MLVGYIRRHNIVEEQTASGLFLLEIELSQVENLFRSQPGILFAGSCTTATFKRWIFQNVPLFGMSTFRDLCLLLVSSHLNTVSTIRS